jgi:Na+/melibiose symporter-like transporter
MTATGHRSPASIATKLAYAVGALSDSIKTFSFTTFLLFYYTTVLGLPGTWLGVAMSVGLVWDAVVDPLIGHLSDRSTLEFGRRHSFMLAGALCAGASFAAVFNPPSGLSSGALFAWLMLSSLCLRSSNSLFMVPYYALGAEMATDSDERTSISGYRAGAVLGGTLITTAVAFLVFLPEGTVGGVETRFTRGSYQSIGVVFGLAITLAALTATLGTLRQRRHLSTTTAVRDGALTLRHSIIAALRDRSFRVLVWASALCLTATAINAALTMHFLTYHARIIASQSVTWYFTGFYTGALAGVLVWTRVTQRLGKHHVYAATSLVAALIMSAGYWLVGEGRPFGTGSVAILIVASALTGFFSIAGAVVVPSMIADITARDEVGTGSRRDGLFFGIYSLGQQLSGGVAVLIASVLVDRFAGLIPAQAEQSVQTIERLVILSNLAPAVLLMAGGLVVLRYRPASDDALPARRREVRPASGGAFVPGDTR